jgi:hypothetical protein
MVAYGIDECGADVEIENANSALETASRAEAVS